MVDNKKPKKTAWKKTISILSRNDKIFLFISIILIVGIILREPPEIEQQYEQSEMFFIYVGLYANDTHPCLTHSDTCDAEFKKMVVDYTISSLDGKFFLQDSAMTGENGFLDLSLPKNKDYFARFTVNGKVGVGFIPTYLGDSDCITDIQVQ